MAEHERLEEHLAGIGAAAERPPASSGAVAVPGVGASLTGAQVLAMQRSAGNAAVADLLAARGGGVAVLTRCACGGLAPEGGQCEACRRRQVLARQTLTAPLPGPGGPGGGNRCIELLGEILSFVHGGLTHILGGKTFTGSNIKRGLIERFQDMLDDKADLYNRHRYKTNPGPGGLGSWEGHKEQLEMQQRGLRNRLSEWVRNNCDDPSSGLPAAEATRAYEEALEWATRPAPAAPNPKPVATPKTASDISWSDVLDVLIVIGLSIVLVAAVLAALADPEPVSKVALAVGSAALALLILGKLGLVDEPDPNAIAAAENYPEQDEAVA